VADETAATAPIEGIRWDERGLVPCIAQDAGTGEVLMLAWMNAEALGLTLERREVHFFSRSRNELWRKGETSGNVLALRSLRYDCDCDTLLALVEPAGPACHTGRRSCFYREATPGETAAVDGDGPAEAPAATFEAIPRLDRVLADRVRDRPEGSYTVELLDNPALIREKVMEEAEEVTRAAREESDERVAEEAADVLYHLEVLLASRGVSREAVLEVLNERAR
jgi:phosphoribosyl-ATP pyrophosphohydrolase/phosphoribosyl-AMP cyclohydrolase